MTKREILDSLDVFTTAYIETLLWTGCEYSSEEELESADLRDDHGPEDFSLAALREILSDCETFQADNAPWIGERSEQAGHDFCLTRNRHGAGFWDGDWAEDAGQKLTDAAHVYGSQSAIGTKGRKRLGLCG